MISFALQRVWAEHDLQGGVDNRPPLDLENGATHEQTENGVR